MHPFFITVKPKTFDLSMQKKIKQEIQDLLQKRIICSSNSPYLISILVVKKKNETIRICLALIRLNAAMIYNG